MQDVKDTLWKWFIQLSAVLGLCCSIYAAYSCALGALHPLPTPPDLPPDVEPPEIPPEVLRMIRAWMIAMALLLGPMLGTVWFRMILLRKWAAGVICALGAWVAITSLAASSGSGELHSVMARLAGIAYVVLLGCALILKPKIWRPGL